MASPSVGMILSIIIVVVAALLVVLFTLNIYFYWNAYRGNCQAIGETNSGFMVMINLVGMLLSILVFVLALIAIFVDRKSKTPKMPGFDSKSIAPFPAPMASPTPAVDVTAGNIGGF